MLRLLQGHHAAAAHRQPEAGYVDRRQYIQ
jgi:hypothetical protein